MRLEENAICHTLHSQHANLLLDQLGQNQFRETSIVRIHYVERHLHGVEFETQLCRDFQHVKVNVGILVPGKAEVADLSGLACFQ